MAPDWATEIGDRLTRIALFLDASAAEMARKLEMLMAGEGATLQDVAKEAVDLRKWAQLAYEERNKIEKLVQESADRGGGHDIDFAEARAQIGRRLDRIRAEAGAGEISR